MLFLSNGQNVEAWDAATGKGLWYSQIGGLSAPPVTFMLDGKQHMLFSAGGGLYLFVSELEGRRRTGCRFLDFRTEILAGPDDAPGNAP